MTAHQKGSLVEDIVAMLHRIPGVSAVPRARIQIPGMNRPIIVDVLLSGDVAGTPFRIAIECKNYKKAIEKGAIDTFVGNLLTIGIPPSHGMFVSTSGYTRGAKDRAKLAGIRLLVLNGLNQCRLASAINDALLSVLYCVLHIENISTFPYLPPDPGGRPGTLQIADTAPGALFDAIWRQWVTGSIPSTLGTATILARTVHAGAAVDYRVVGYAGTVPGTASALSLRDHDTSQLYALRVDADFQGPNTLQLHAVIDEATAATRPNERVGAAVVTHRVRVPRIVTTGLFWPPSQDAIAKVIALRNAGERLDFARIEGRDLSRAWQYFESQRPLGSDDRGHRDVASSSTFADPDGDI